MEDDQLFEGLGKQDGDAPQETASILSKLTFGWVTPFLKLGYSRPVQQDDLWPFPKDRLAETLAASLEEAFYMRCPPEVRPHSIRSMHRSSVHDDTLARDSNAHEQRETANPSISNKSDPQSVKYDSSLVKALYRAFIKTFWTAGLLELIGDTLKTTTPLVTKLLLAWLVQSYTYHQASDQQNNDMQAPRGIGYGVGLVVALFAMQQFMSLIMNHFFMQSLGMGISVRTALTSLIFRKSLRLSARSRLSHNTGKITTMITTDTARIDRLCMFLHLLWVAPLQIAIGIALLLVNLGPSALAGLAVLLIGFPLQRLLTRRLLPLRRALLAHTDARVRMVGELLQGVRLIKAFAWEDVFAARVGDARAREIRAVRRLVLVRSALVAGMGFLPGLAAIVTFVTYALSGHTLDVATVFSSLQYFNVIRLPISIYPLVLSNTMDALVALERIGEFLTAEELADEYTIDNADSMAVRAKGNFTWELSMPAKANLEENVRVKDSNRRWWQIGRKAKEMSKSVLPTNINQESSETVAIPEEIVERPFELNGLNIEVPKGAFVAIVGRIGSGKSSLLQALLGEMRKKEGSVSFGGSVAYSPQTPWIKNATLRENIVFGQWDDDKKFRDVIHACSLERDLELLPHGDLTELGEKGINLSGGQKARISIARTAYAGSDIALLDDCLSAVDAQVSQAILKNCLLTGPLATKTRILVTHALHFLDRTDYIYVMEDGNVAEHGTYKQLMENSKVFSRVMQEYGNLEKQEITPQSEETTTMTILDKSYGKNANASLMQAEERAIGAVTWNTYFRYLRFTGSIHWGTFILILLVLAQATLVGNNVFLGFWTSDDISGFSQGGYIGVYAGLGIASAVFAFILNISFSYIGLIASLNMFNAALKAVLRSPVSFFDTTPIGRILARLSKDQDTLDNQISGSLYTFLSTLCSVVGVMGLVFYTFPYLGIIFLPLTAIYWVVSKYYRRTSVEVKRISSLSRSVVYASLAETLTGLATIRAYREQKRSIGQVDHGLDQENRASFMSLATARWLDLRLDTLANSLILAIGLFAAVFRNTVQPSKTGVVLSYTLTVTQWFSEMVNQFVQTEQNMNTVERVLHYTTLPSEAEVYTSSDPPADWPSQGVIEFNDVQLSYREGLPLVLNGVSFNVKASEKVGIVGRTGAGKSSLIQALFRVVELQSGRIEIDGIDVSKVGLSVLRGRLALVPQDSVLFLGSLRENLDPMGIRSDAELLSILQRTRLLPTSSSSASLSAENKYSLDVQIGDEGSNYSAGEKQLLALARALVKGSRIIVLDEATSSVDAETDSKLQQTIRSEFSSATLICIAHRLNTIAYYDRVLVMDAGNIAEYDTVLNLFENPGSIFRSLCNEAGLSKQDILRIREESEGSFLNTKRL